MNNFGQFDPSSLSAILYPDAQVQAAAPGMDGTLGVIPGMGQVQEMGMSPTVQNGAAMDAFGASSAAGGGGGLSPMAAMMGMELLKGMASAQPSAPSAPRVSGGGTTMNNKTVAPREKAAPLDPQRQAKLLAQQKLMGG